MNILFRLLVKGLNFISNAKSVAPSFVQIALVSLVLIISTISLNGCAKKERKIQLSGHTMGTTYHITLAGKPANPHLDKESLEKSVDKLLKAVNQQMSTYKLDSEISRFNQSSVLTWFSISSEFLKVVKTAQKVSKQTQGAFDITVAPLVDLWGFGNTQQLTSPKETQLKTIISQVGYQKLSYQESPPAIRKSHEKLQIDLSAIAKGFAVDKISEFLIQQNYENFMVEIGGELRVKGHAPSGSAWRISIRNPNLDDPKINQKILMLSDRAVATSGNYLNYFIKEKVRYSHILDPRTGQAKTQKAMSVTVVHDSAMLADAYATALMVLGFEEGQKLAQQLKLEVYWAGIQ